MIIFLDGDNAPGNRAQGISALAVTDRLYVYYCANNPYYKSSKKREALLEQAECYVEFIKTESANNSVDFAIAIDAGIMAHKRVSGTIVLISGDKHFKTITTYLKATNPDADIHLEENIHDAILKYKMLEIQSLDAFHLYLCELYGQQSGTSLFKYLERLYAADTECSPLRTFKALIRTILRVEI